MALTRKFLKALGIEEEKIDEIISAHIEVTDALKKQAEGREEVEKQLEAVTRERDKLKAEAGDDNSAKKIAELEKLVEDYKGKETLSAKKEAFKAVLKEAGIDEKRFGSIIKLTSFDEIELDKDGKVKGADKLIDSIRKDYSEFVVSEITDTAKPATPPAQTTGKYSSKSEIMAIKDTAARQAAIAENIELFNK